MRGVAVAMRSAVEIAPTGSRPAIRLRPVPRSEPPFDDESAPQVWAPPRQPALEWPAGTQRSPEKGRPASPAVAGAAGDAKLAARRFVHLCVEVLNGFRPAAHLRRMALPAEAAEVVAQGLAGARRAAELRRAGHRGARPARRPVPVAVLRLRLCEPRPGAVEAAVTLVTGDRTWAMAFRMELHQQTWATTALVII
ncbi:Rv3235 family protein [Actinoplanes sp. NPDC049802]|uniref:Rv3235 family protein n=1 Tax=Actinoplanes sp. NPDC049802 TaxID=3154742 RepID=UPI0033E3ACD2